MGIAELVAILDFEVREEKQLLGRVRCCELDILRKSRAIEDDIIVSLPRN